MNFLISVLNKENKALESILTKLNQLTVKESIKFLPIASQLVIHTISQEFEILNTYELNCHTNQHIILDKINLDQLSTLSGIRADEAHHALKNILPNLLELIQNQVVNLQALLPLMSTKNIFSIESHSEYKHPQPQLIAS